VGRLLRVLLMVVGFLATISGVGLIVSAAITAPRGWPSLIGAGGLLLAAGLLLYALPRKWNASHSVPPTNSTQG
jgi:hypothetical protein